MPNIYKVRDSSEDVLRVSAEDLVHKIQKNGVFARYTKNFKETVNILLNELSSDDILITMGAGPINEISEEYVRQKNI